MDVDSAWLPVKKYVEDGLKVDPKKEKCFYSEWDPAYIGLRGSLPGVRAWGPPRDFFEILKKFRFGVFCECNMEW